MELIVQRIKFKGEEWPLLMDDGLNPHPRTARRCKLANCCNVAICIFNFEKKIISGFTINLKKHAMFQNNKTL